MEEKIHIEKKNRVAYLSLNKPPANGYEIDLLGLLIQKIKTINIDDDIKVVVLQSALQKFFCAGADIKVFGSNTIEENQRMVLVAREACHWITNSPKIFIAALNGYALGGGLELAMACDIRLGAEGNYSLGLPEIKLGLMPGNGGTPRLIHLIGAGRAMELLIMGEGISPARALAYGLINRLFPKDSFADEVKKYAENLAMGPAKAMAQVKHFTNQSMGMNLKEALQLETECVNQLYATKDAQEAFEAFLEKRKPKFE